MNKTWFEKLQNWYWKLIPYDWRPERIWYRLKCFFWHRYTTVKPRYLGHTWCDKRNLIPHMMFELLCQFVERECSPGHIEWYGEYGHKITVEGTEKYVIDEMKDLIAWWHQVWNKEVEEVEDMLWTEALRHSPISDFVPLSDHLVEWKPQFANDHDEEVYRCCVMACNKLERIMNKALEERLHRLVNIIPYMWT